MAPQVTVPMSPNLLDAHVTRPPEPGPKATLPAPLGLVLPTVVGGG